MLKLDQDIEAELGIDSIKRVEILGALQRVLPEPVALALKARMDVLTRAKTLGTIVDLVMASSADPGVPANGAEAPDLVNQSADLCNLAACRFARIASDAAALSEARRRSAGLGARTSTPQRRG